MAMWDLLNPFLAGKALIDGILGNSTTKSVTESIKNEATDGDNFLSIFISVITTFWATILGWVVNTVGIILIVVLIFLVIRFIIKNVIIGKARRR